MQEPKKKVSAKRFVADFQAGRTDEELMEIYALDHKNLNRLFKKLIEKELLDANEVRIHKTRDRTGDTSLGEASIEVDSSERVAASTVGVAEHREVDPAVCPQCGAPASEKGLTCPECGHVLPGSRRWEEVDRKESIFHRLPALAWGCILAVPVAIVTYLFFAYYMYPAMSQETDKRVQAIRKETGGMTPQDAAKRVAAIKHRNDLQAEVNRLISLDIFSRVETDYSVFTAGAMWAGLSRTSQTKHLSEISAAMARAEIPADFQVVDSGGFTVATVKHGSIELAKSDSSLDEFEAGLFEKKRAPSADRDPTLEELEQQARPERRLDQLKGLPRSE